MSQKFGQQQHDRGWQSCLKLRVTSIPIFSSDAGEASRLQFFVGDDGMLEHRGARFDLGDARRIAIAYLARVRLSRAA